MKTAYPFPPNPGRGICPCSCLIEGDAIEDRLRAHVEQAHPGEARRDATGEIIIRHATNSFDAWRLVNDGLPVLLVAP